MRKRTVLAGLGVVVGTLIIGLFFLRINSKGNVAQTDPRFKIMATVNNVAITQAMIDREIAVSRFNANNPLPPLTGDDLTRAADEALNQLITRQLMLQAASRQNFAVDDALIEQRVKTFFGDKHDPALISSLQQADVTYTDLAWWLGEITTVETFTIEVIMAGAAPETRQQVYNDWLNAQRATANIKTYFDGQEQTLTRLMGEPAPDFTLTNLAGQPVSLADYRGKVVLINFWATWCPSCISEMPDYEQVYQQYDGEFVVLGINLQESQAQVADYAVGLGLTFPVLLDETGRVTTRQYQVTGMPGSVIIDRQGLVFYRHLGPMNAETLRARLAELGL